MRTPVIGISIAHRLVKSESEGEIMLQSQKRSIIQASDDRKQRPRDLTTIDPDVLRDKVFDAFSALTEDDRALMRDNLLTRLERAGVDISSSLFQLGIPVETADDLTSSDIAKLLRYARINKPEAIKSAASLLGELIVPDDEAEKCVKPYRRAA